MNPKRLLIVILCLSLLQSYLNAQDKSKVQFGKVSPEDFILPTSSIIDSNANAVVLSDKGTTHFVGNKFGWFSYVYKRERRIKIVNKKAFEAASEEIDLYGKEDRMEKVDNLTGSTYNLESGKVIEAKLDKKDIFEENLNKNWQVKKFTMPAVKVGSIIEFTYTITSPFDFRLPTWEFQSRSYPCLWSEYEVVIPQSLSYVFIKQGIHDFCVDKGSEGRELYKIIQKGGEGSISETNNDLTITAHTVKHSWAMKNIPAFNVENFISTPANYLDKIDFQLSQTNNNESVSEEMNSWKRATEQLMASDHFGVPLQGDLDWLSPVTDKIGVDNVEPLDQARLVYYYLTNNFTCINNNSIYLKTTLGDVLKKKNGTAADLNLLLVAMLRKKGFPADPVLLSTREHGFNPSNYPIMEKLNYVIARVKVGDKIYYLDAAHSQLGFGQLAGDCYNGHARIISTSDSGSVWFNADSLKEKKMTMVLLTNNDKGEIEGSYQSTLGELESYNTRVKLGSTGEKEFFKNIQTSYGEDLDISNTGIDSLDKPEMPAFVHYEFRLKQAAGSPMIYFNPLFADAYRENPFKAAERKYPVEMPSAFDDVYIFNMEIPAGYTIEELPKSTKVAFNGTDGLFEYLVAAEGSTIQLRARVKLNRAYFLPEDYTNLRDFFAYIVKKESEQIVLKKKS
ncbi:MAG TPA: DUF3857 and transglutaminase domain-containing protein [Puia sp.]|nr:DUF3857 and transglutaminase domain-containing protein [Puia sp.]